MALKISGRKPFSKNQQAPLQASTHASPPPNQENTSPTVKVTSTNADISPNPVPTSSTSSPLDTFTPPNIDDIQPAIVPTENADPNQTENIREKCRRFRILTVGRANSGKTTILKKVCNTNEEPKVHLVQYGYRNEYPASVLKDPTAMRGIHDINLEITYESNPNFIFHDSMGFEAGSTTEVEKVRKFIEERLKRTNLQDRLHAIWFCIPTDFTRVAFEAELQFFRQNTGDIPVVLVFTKWDGRIIRTCADLQNEGMSFEEAEKAAPARSRQILEEHYIPVFKNAPYPPASYAVLGDMDRPESKCSELSAKTAAALNNGVLKKLFVSVQTHNLEICMEGGIREALHDVIFSGSAESIDYERVVRWTLSWFPHVYRYHDYSDRGDFGDELFDDFLDREFDRDDQPFRPAITASEQAFSSPYLQALSIAACAAIVATCSFELKDTTQCSTAHALDTSIKEYLASSQYVVVKEAIHTKFGQYADVVEISRDTIGAISKELFNICKDNLKLSKMPEIPEIPEIPEMPRRMTWKHVLRRAFVGLSRPIMLLFRR